MEKAKRNKQEKKKQRWDKCHNKLAVVSQQWITSAAALEQ